MPDVPQLVDAYRAFWSHVDSESRRIDTEAAETIAAEAARVKKEVVRESIIIPLGQRGYLQPVWGAIVIYPPETVPATS